MRAKFRSPRLPETAFPVLEVHLLHRVLLPSRAHHDHVFHMGNREVRVVFGHQPESASLIFHADCNVILAEHYLRVHETRQRHPGLRFPCRR